MSGITSSLKNMFLDLYIKSGIPVKYSIYTLRKKLEKCHGIDDVVDLAFTFNDTFSLRKFSIRPIQVKEEITELLSTVKDLPLEIYLEIGTAKGGTLFMFSQISSQSATLMSIDLPYTPNGTGYPNWKMHYYESFKKEGQSIRLIRSDSHDPTTLRRVKDEIGNRKVDLLFIDGDHTYNGVKSDFEMYSHLVRNGGIVSFHDIAENSLYPDWGVYRFWNEIKKEYDSLEIIYSENSGGIGVLFV